MRSLMGTTLRALAIRAAVLVGACVAVFWGAFWVLRLLGTEEGAARGYAWIATAVVAFAILAMGANSPFNRNSGVHGDLTGRRDWRNDPLNPHRH